VQKESAFECYGAYIIHDVSDINLVVEEERESSPEKWLVKKEKEERQ